MDKTQILQYINEHFYPLPSACLEKLAAGTEVLQVDKKTLLVAEGTYAKQLYFLVEGAARAYYLKDGKDITDWFAFDKEFICAIQSFFMLAPSDHFIETLAPTKLLAIDHACVAELSDEYPAFDRLGKIIITEVMLKLQKRVVSIQFETAQEKYQNLLTIRPDIELRVPLGHIASYLGITLETLSRIRKKKRRI